MSPDVPGLGPIRVLGVGAWQWLEQDLNLELDGTSLPLLEARVREVTQEQWSGDLQVSGVSCDDRLDWDLGFFYLQENIEDPASRSNAQTVLEPLAESQLGLIVGPITAGQIDSRSELEHKTIATFLQGVITATDDLKLTLGARYVHENKTIDRSSDFWACQDGISNPNVGICVPWKLPWEEADDDPDNDGPPFVIPGPTVESDGDEDYDAWTAVVNFSYDFSDLLPDYNDHFMLFAGWSRGFRSGGFNYLANDSEAEIQCDTPYDPDAAPGTTCQTQFTSSQTFDPEFLNAAEVGIKTDWLGRRLRLNLTYFYDYHQDIQQRQTIVTDQTGFGTTNAVLNTGNAIFQGGEIEFEALPIPELMFRLGVGLTFARYDGDVWFDDPEASRLGSESPAVCADSGGVWTNGICAVQKNLKNEDLINTPPVTISATLAYTRELLDWGTLMLSMGWYMGGDIYFSVENHETLYQPRFHTFDARASFTLPEIPKIRHMSARFDLWVKNFTDQRFPATGIDLVNYHLRYNNPPRTYGGSITLMFGGD
jgi:iron complex outermembrane receptor protein